MWKRDLSAGCTGFTAAATLFGMIRYLAAPELVVAFSSSSVRRHF